ncbi:hypothetical protein VPHK394_0033 [Vibrio phage K394]
MHTTTVLAISDHIKLHADTPFEWGVFDCCVFTSHIVKIQTDIDLYADYVGKYNSEQSAVEIQKQVGTIESQLDKHFERVDPMHARRGDIHMLADGVMALQFSGHRWATTTTGVKPSRVESKLCWRIK